jgi:hypothetical protein
MKTFAGTRELGFDLGLIASGMDRAPGSAANATITTEWARRFMKTMPMNPPTLAPSKVLAVVPSGMRMPEGTTINAKSKPARAPNTALGTGAPL